MTASEASDSTRVPLLDDAIELHAFDDGLQSSQASYELLTETWDLPADYAKWLEAWRKDHADEWSGPRLAVADLDWSEPGRLRVKAVPSEWAEVRAWQAVLPERYQELASRFRLRDLRGFQCAIPTLFVIHAIVRTSDGHVLASKRSPTLHFHPGAWSLSFEEGVEESDLAESDFVRACALRGLREEFGLLAEELAGTEVAVLAVLLEKSLLTPALVVDIRIPQESGDLEDLRPNEEVERFACPPLEPTALLAWWRELGSEPWHPTSRYRLFKTATGSMGAARAWSLVDQLRSLEDGGSLNRATE